MADDQLQLEVDWCLARLEEKLAAMDPYSRPAQEAAKVHRILKSSKAPVIKKRQAMRNMFGDYRAKMKATKKKSSAAMKSKVVADTEPPSQSKFLRRSTEAQAVLEVSEKSVSCAMDTLNQLSVNQTESPTDPQTTSATHSDPTVVKSSSNDSLSEGEFKFNFDGSEYGPDTDGAAASTSASGDTDHQNYFVIKDSTSSEEFRFNFTVDETE